MDVIWIVIELLVNGVEVAFFILFASNRLGVQDQCRSWVLVYGILFFTLLSLLNWQGTSPMVTALTSLVLAVAFGLLLLNGSVNEKIFWTTFTMAILFGIDLLASFIFINMVGIPLSILLQQTGYRLILMIFVKLIQAFIIFLLYYRVQSKSMARSGIMWLLCTIPILSIAMVMLLFTGEKVVRGDAATQLACTLASLVILLLNILVFIVFALMARKSEKLLVQGLKLKQMEMQVSYYEELDAAYQVQQKFRHDLRNHLQVLQGLIANKEIGPLQDYLKEISVTSEVIENLIQSGNSIIDVVLNSQANVTSRYDITFIVEEAAYPHNLQIGGMDLSALLSNLLNNAIEALQRMEDNSKEKFISVTIGPRKGYFMIRVINTSDGREKLDPQTSQWLTMKDTPGHGLGHGIIQDIVEKYDGLLHLSHQDGIFTAQVLIPID